MAHKVISRFQDKDTKQTYNSGDLYEHENAERVAFLVEKGYLDKSETQPKYPKHTGGSWYELSNGEKIQGKDEAFAAEKEITDRGE